MELKEVSDYDEDEEFVETPNYGRIIETYDDIMEEQMETQKIEDLQNHIKRILDEIPLNVNTIELLEHAVTTLEYELGQKKITDYADEFTSVEDALNL